MPEGKPVALVTGATGGIGIAICLALAEAGHHVLAACRNPMKGDDLVGKLRSLGHPADVVLCDVSRVEAVKEAFRRVDAITERLDVVVNNAGMNRAALFEQTTPDLWHELLDVNLVGPMAICWHAIPRLRKTRGVIVNITSESGLVGTSGEGPYAAAKAGLTALTKSLARELARDGIRVNAVSPGPVETEMLRDMLGRDPEAVKARTAKIIPLVPLRRLGQPAEIASAVVYLASSGASFITGQTIHVGGGVTMY